MPGPALTRAAASGATAALLVAVLLAAGRPTPLAQMVAALSILAMAGHAVLAIGWVEAALFAAICLAVTIALENIGIATAWLFGDYEFVVGRDLPRLGLVPLIVGPLYFGMGYPAWTIAGTLLGNSGARPADWRHLIGQPVVAAFAMVQWDAVMDPSNSTLAGAWLWHRGGGFFGVPLSNFLGWYLTTYAFFQLFALVLYRRRGLPPHPTQSRWFRAVPILFYLAAGLSHVVPFLADGDRRLVDAAGHVWSAADLRETAMVVLLAGMLPISVLALLRLFDRNAPVGRDAR